jgi:hypothetical protein
MNNTLSLAVAASAISLSAGLAAIALPDRPGLWSQRESVIHTAATRDARIKFGPVSHQAALISHSVSGHCPTSDVSLTLFFCECRIHGLAEGSGPSRAVQMIDRASAAFDIL